MHGRQYLWEVPGSVNGCDTIVISKLAISTPLQQEMHSLVLHAETAKSLQQMMSDATQGLRRVSHILDTLLGACAEQSLSGHL